MKDDIEWLPIRFAILAPSTALYILGRGGLLHWSLGRGWREASGIIDFLEEKQPQHLRAFLDQAIDEIADGLFLRYDDSTEHLETFFASVERTTPTILPLVFAKIDREAVAEHRTARLNSGKLSVTCAVLALLDRVSKQPGPAQSLAEELKQQYPKSECSELRIG